MNAKTSLRVVVAALVAGLSCAGGGRPEERLGSIELALSAPGPDGRSYQLPGTAFMALFRGEEAAGALSLGGAEPTRTVALPVGAYQGRVRDAEGIDDDGVAWRLLRLNADGTTTLVTATLQVPNPAFAVLEGVVTGVVLRFTVLDVGDVTFTTGVLEVGVAVDRAERPPAEIILEGDLVVTSQQLSGGDALDDRLRADLGTPVPVSLSARLLPWRHRIGHVCADLADVHVNGGGAHAGIAAWLHELAVLGPAATVCVSDDDGSQLRVVIERVGAPASELGTVLEGAHTFGLSVGGVLPYRAWDGSRLRLGEAANGTSLRMGEGQLRLEGPQLQSLAATSFAGTWSLSLVPDWKGAGDAGAPPEAGAE